MDKLERSIQPSPAAMSSRRRDTLAHLVAQRNSLVARLEKASLQIEEARLAGEDVQQWETFWIRLLRQYEQVCDRIAELEASEELRRAS